MRIRVESSSITSTGTANIDLSEYEYITYGRGRDNKWSLYRKIDNGKGVWAAKHCDTGEIKPITYDQARGFEPIGNSRIDTLSRELGTMLLPKKEASTGKLIQEKRSAESFIRKLEYEIRAALNKFMQQPKIGFLEDEIDYYTSVGVKLKGEHIEISVGAELSYSSLEDLCTALNKVIEKYDHNAYFEPECPGRIVAYLMQYPYID